MSTVKRLYKTGNGKQSLKNCKRLYLISSKYIIIPSLHKIIVENSSNIYTNRYPHIAIFPPPKLHFALHGFITDYFIPRTFI